MAITAKNDRPSNFSLDPFNACAVHYELTDICSFAFYMMKVQYNRIRLTTKLAQRAVLYHARQAGKPYLLRAARRVLSSISRKINKPLDTPCKPKK